MCKSWYYTYFYNTCRIADIYVVFKSTLSTVCGSSALHISEVTKSSTPSNTQSIAYDYNLNLSLTRNITFPEQDELLLVAKRMTLVSLYYEFTVGCLIILSIARIIYNCNKISWSDCSYRVIKDSVKPFVLIDCVIIIILGPFGNVYLFILGCLEAYVMVALRIGFYLSTISLPAVFSYLYNHRDTTEEELDTFDLKSFALILATLALKLVACSSCLATFINVAYPEGPVVRYTYLSFTILIGISALSTYYETLLRLVEVVQNWMEQCLPFHRWLYHFTFWPSVVANIGLVGLNSFILHQYIHTEGEKSTEVSLVLTILSLLFTVPLYVFFGVFCGHGPLYRACYQQICSSEKV